MLGGGGALLYTHTFVEQSRERISIDLTLKSWQGGTLFVAKHTGKYTPPLPSFSAYGYNFLKLSISQKLPRRTTVVVPMYSSSNCQKEAALKNICQGDP